MEHILLTAVRERRHDISTAALVFYFFLHVIHVDILDDAANAFSEATLNLTYFHPSHNKACGIQSQWFRRSNGT